MAETVEVLQSVTLEGGVDDKIPTKVFRPQPKGIGSRVYKEGNTFVVVAPELERIVARIDVTSFGMRWQLKRKLARLGVSKALERAGIKSGDRVRCGNLEWDW
jgi:Obg family GTPase CgtA-like protein